MAERAAVPLGDAALAVRCAEPEGRLLWLRLRRDRQEAGLAYGPGLARYGIAQERLILQKVRLRPSP